MTPIMPDRMSWASSIGLFILNFGTLDLLIQDYLENHLAPDEFGRFKERHFQDRVERIRKLTQQPEFSAAKREQFQMWATRLAHTREIRNHLAHGLLWMSLADDKETWQITLSLPRDLCGSNSPEALHLNLQQLLNASEELADLTEAFKAWDGNWMTDVDIRF